MRRREHNSEKSVALDGKVLRVPEQQVGARARAVPMAELTSALGGDFASDARRFMRGDVSTLPERARDVDGEADNAF